MLDLRRDVHMGASIGAFWAATRVLAAMGDPSGLLETTDDLPGLARALRRQPVVRTRGPLMTADHEVCSTVLRCPDASANIPEPRSAFEAVMIGPKPRPGRIDPLLDAIIAKDGDDHSRLRRLVQPAFTNSAMQSWRAVTERIAADLVDRLPSNRPVDLVADWAAPLPMAVICDVLGVPFADRATFKGWGDTLAAGLDRARSLPQARRIDRAADSLTAYLTTLLAERRRTPADDLLSALANAEVDGDVLGDREIIATASFLLIAGFETTVNLLGAGTEVLMRHATQLRELARDPGLVPGTVEEALRFTSPVQYTFRTALAPIDLPGGETLEQGSTIILLIAGANRDPAVFDEPESFDIHRANARRHLAFGFGVHHCLGAGLARMEAEVAWGQLLARFGDVDEWRLAGDTVPTSGRMIRGLRSLPVRLGPAAA